MKKIITLLLSLTLMMGLNGCASQKKKSIVFGLQKNYAPFSYYKNGKLTGYDVEVCKLIAKKLNMKAVFKTMNNNQLTKALDNGTVDAIGNKQEVTYNVNEAKGQLPDYYFSDPYKYSRLIVVTRKSNTTIKHFDDQRDLKIAMSRGDFFETSVVNDGGDIVDCTDFDACMKAVENKKASATMNDLLAYEYYMKQNKKANLKGAVISANLFPLCFMFRNNSKKLSLQFTKAISSLNDDGSLSDLSMRYFYQDISTKE
jgi:cystine transport system substrate-binding protein